MTGVPPHPPAVVLAAGLLPSWLDAAAAPEQVAARLADVLDGQALWDPHQDGNPLTPRTLEAVPAELPSWRPPDTGLLDAHLKHCVLDAAKLGDDDAAIAKIQEATDAINRLVRS